MSTKLKQVVSNKQSLWEANVCSAGQEILVLICTPN